MLRHATHPTTPKKATQPIPAHIQGPGAFTDSAGTNQAHSKEDVPASSNPVARITQAPIRKTIIATRSVHIVYSLPGQHSTVVKGVR